MNDEILSTTQIAKMLHVTNAAVTQWCRLGKLPAFRAGGRWRVQRADLDRFVRQGVPFVSEANRVAA